jgi:hypothetical protein
MTFNVRIVKIKVTNSLFVVRLLINSFQEKSNKIWQRQ